MRRYAWPGNVRELANVLQRAVLVNETGRLDPGGLGIDGPRPAAGADALMPLRSPFDFEHEDCTVAEVERRLLRAALEHVRGNVSEAARLLGLTRGGLRHRMDKLGL